MWSGVLISVHHCVHMLKARLWIRKEAAVWSGRGGRHPKPLQIHVPANRAGEDMWWWREPWGTFLILHEEATGTRGHLIAGPGSRGNRFLAFLWTITSKRGAELASRGDMPLRTTLRWGGDGSFLPRNIHPDHLSENPVSRIPCLQREGYREHTTCLQVTLISSSLYVYLMSSSWAKEGKRIEN